MNLKLSLYCCYTWWQFIIPIKIYCWTNRWFCGVVDWSFLSTSRTSTVNKYGIKLHSPTEPQGIVIKVSIFTELLDDQGGKDHTVKVVIKFNRGKAWCRTLLFMDIYYNSYELVLILLQRKILCTGTLNMRRISIPLDVKNTKLSRGKLQQAMRIIYPTSEMERQARHALYFYWIWKYHDRVWK